MAAQCPLGFDLGVGYDCYDKCNTDLCPPATYESCRREARALHALISLCLKPESEEKPEPRCWNDEDCEHKSKERE